MDNIYKNMNECLKLRGLSHNTHKIYLRILRKFIEYFNESPENLNIDHIKEYLLHLIDIGQSRSTIEVAHAALKFIYQIVLRKSEAITPIPHLKKEKKLPVVLNREEIKSLLNVAVNIKHKAILAIAYSAGLRTGEIANLKINDIDSSRMQIRIENSKGAKDRYTILSIKTLEILRKYWKTCRPIHWLFPGYPEGTPMTYKGIAHIFKTYKEKAGIKKPATTHSLRHSFATHLLEDGIDIYHIQHLLGHTSIETTTVYLHLRRADLQKVTSPLDQIDKKI